MPATITRASLTRGRGYVTYNGASFFCREKIEIKHAPTWEKVSASMFGAIDKYKKDVIGKINLKLWGAWENLGILFPAYVMNPIPGTSIFGAADIALHVQGDSPAGANDFITYANAAVTKVSDLYLGVDSELFQADVEFTWLIGNTANPEDANAYHTRGTGAYSDATAAFAKTNYKRVRFTGAWGAIAGFGQITPQKGVKIAWNIGMQPITVDGLGTRDMSISDEGVIGSAKLIPLGPTLLQLKAASQEESAHGTLASALAADLVFTGNGGSPIVTLKAAGMTENGLVFDSTDLRVAEAKWETTRGFTGGVPAAISSVA